MERRTYVGEMEWALEMINSRNQDRNPNRFVQVDAATKYGLQVAICRRSHEPLPERPKLDKLI